MKTAVRLLQRVDVYFSVNLRAGKGSVPEQLLNHPDISTIMKQMCCAGMP
jgi:hypothetical protein